MAFNLKRTLKALLFSTSEPLSIKEVQAVITRYHERVEVERAKNAGEDGSPPHDVNGQGIFKHLMDQVPSLLTAAQIREAIQALKQDLEEQGEVYSLREGPKGFQLTVYPPYAEWVRLLRDEPRPQSLSPAAMETLAIVAYRQPVTRAEIEGIRGVAIDSPLRRLLERELVCVSGRAELPGRPVQYGTTDQFLEYCGLSSIQELPASDVLSPNQITEWLHQANTPEKVPGDSDVGLPGTQETEPSLLVS